MMAQDKAKSDIVYLMSEYHRVGVQTVTVDTLAKALRLKPSTTHQVLQELISEGRVQYGKKNPLSAQARYQVAAEAQRQ